MSTLLAGPSAAKPNSQFQVTEHGGIDPEHESPRFVAKHLSAYHFVKPFAMARVLEIGFGDGYGASFLAEGADEVTAIDLFEKNVRAAFDKYARPNLRFLVMDATEMDLPNDYFDLVVSFQVIEHIPNALLVKYLEEIKRVMKPDGSACLTTLNLKKNLKPGQPYDKSPHHDKEFTPEEFKSFLSTCFGRVELRGLYPTLRHAAFERLKKIGIFKGFPASVNPVTRFYEQVTPQDFRWVSKENLDDCVDLLAVCRK